MEKKDWKDEKSSIAYEDDDVSDYEIIPTPPESESESPSLPIRLKNEAASSPLRVELHQDPSGGGVLVSVRPPRAPARQNGKLKHVPCDIVLAIDVSGSMSAEAPPPVANPDEAERNGLTVLDLVKHAARTILETLDDTDRLAIITFSTDAKVVQRLLPMTAENKALSLQNINALQPDSMTNLWHGIMESIKVFENHERLDCVPAIMVLTDGLPNHMCPNQGYVRKIRSYKLPATLHTFGFGFSLRSGLLKSIAEIGGGNYAFIPDSGMLGTVFIHAVANLQSTFATRVSMTLTTTEDIALLHNSGAPAHAQAPTYNEAMDVDETPVPASFFSRRTRPASARTKKAKPQQLILQLDSLQYGQSRDIFIRYQQKSSTSQTPAIQCRLQGQAVDGSSLNIEQEQYPRTDRISLNELAYHKNRSEICSLISAIFPLNSLEEHQVASDILLEDFCTRIDELAKTIPCDDADNKTLWDDLVGEAPTGQIRLAVSSTTYFERWGKHYLLSVLNAHQKQICNSFKDNGPLLYGSESPLFVQCRDTLDRAFDSLPPPVPSRPPRVRTGSTASGRARINMSRYHRRDNPCFAGQCRVSMADGTRLRMDHLRHGMKVRTLSGSARIAAVVRTQVRDAPMCVMDDLTITPWHPVLLDGTWHFPCGMVKRGVTYDGAIYSILLQKDEDSNMHTIEVEGIWATTLGHGVVSYENDVRSHSFFGDWKAVAASLKHLRLATDGVLESNGLDRDLATGLACGFRSREPAVVVDVARL